MRVRIEQELDTEDRKPRYEFHIFDLTSQQYDQVTAFLNHMLAPIEDPPAYDIRQSKPFNYKEFRNSFEIVSKGGRWHIMSMEDGKSKGEFDNYDSAVNHLNYICHMADRSGREPL